MKKTILLLALLLGTSTISAQSIQCTGIALSTGVQCEKKVALKHNRTRCHHHIDTDYTTQEDIDFNHVTTDTENSSNYPILEGLWVLLQILFIVGIIPTAIMYGIMLTSMYLDKKYSIDQGTSFCFLMFFVCSLPTLYTLTFN